MKKRILLISATAFTLWFLYGAYRGITDIETGESLPSVDWLPEEATNVSFYRSYLNTAYEFDISEHGFRDWSRWELEEIVEPVRIPRYLEYSTPPPQEPSDPTSEEIEAFIMEQKNRSATIKSGLYYGYLQGNGGGIWVGYDRESGRAFYKSAPR